MKTQARVVIIGGGAMGAGLLYHLVKEGVDRLGAGGEGASSLRDPPGTQRG